MDPTKAAPRRNDLISEFAARLVEPSRARPMTVAALRERLGQPRLISGLTPEPVAFNQWEIERIIARARAKGADIREA